MTIVTGFAPAGPEASQSGVMHTTADDRWVTAASVAVAAFAVTLPVFTERETDVLRSAAAGLST
jgi:hypothetical protein